MDKHVIIGNLGGDPETHTSKKDNKPFYTSSVAVTNFVGGENVTTWYKIIMGETYAKRVAIMQKGTKVYVEGKLNTKIYNGKNGAAIDNSISVNHLELLGGMKSKEEAGTASAPAVKGKATAEVDPFANDEDENLPF